MAVSGRTVFKVAIGLSVLCVLVLASGVLIVVRHPLKTEAALSRFGLRTGGFEKRVLDGAEGRLTVYDGGSGPTVVLLHGAGDQAGAWVRPAGVLVRAHRVVIPDLVGHGGSDPDEGPIGIGQVKAGIEMVLDRLCLDEQVVLVGHSLGAWIGCLIAAEHPDRVSRVVLVNGGPVRQDDPAVNLFPTTREEARETMEGLMGSAAASVPDTVLDAVVRHARTGPAARLAQTASEMPAFLFDGRLDEVRVPVDLIWGNADDLFPVSYAQRVRDGLPAARLTTLDDCGHVPMRECPAKLIDALTDVLDAPAPTLEPVPPGDGEDADGGDG